MRRFAIGDIHGCAKALRTVIETIDPTSNDELIFLGDYIDRGPDSRDVIDQIIELQSRCRVVALRGNHELMMMAIISRGLEETVWLANGGRATMTSYNGSLSKIPNSHLHFFRRLLPYYESHDTICVHAGYNPMLPMDEQLDAVIHWNHLPPRLPLPHVSGKRVFVGHTPQPQGNILDGGHVVCIDTYCFGGGFLTAYDLDSNQLIQVNHHGHQRREPALAMVKRFREIKHRLSDFSQRQRLRAREAKPNGSVQPESLPIEPNLGSASNPES